MKQLLIVLFATLLVVLAYVFYTGSKGDTGPDRRRQRPPIQQAGNRGAQRPRAAAGRDVQVKKTTLPDGTEAEQIIDVPDIGREVADRFLEASVASWREMVTEETLVRIEDAWDIDDSTIDFNAEVLVSLELVGGERVEITQSDWRRYLCLSIGGYLIDSKTIELLGRSVAEEYGSSYGFTDEQWEVFFAATAAQKGIIPEEFLTSIAGSYGLSQDAAMVARRSQIEGILAFYPSVAGAESLPKVMRETLNFKRDKDYINLILAQLIKLREDLDNEENLAGLANALEPLSILFPPVLAELRFRQTWSFLDAEMPANAVLGCFVGNVVTEQVLPPWLQPDGHIEYLTVDEIYPLLETDKLTREALHAHLRELVWVRVLGAAQVAEKIALTPEEAWLIHAEEFIARAKTALSMKMIVSGFYAYPSMAHYRAVQRVFEGHKNRFPENWQSEEVMRAFYADHRIFVESWTPACEVILFTPRNLDTDMGIDWERARREAEQVREQIVAGEIEFTSFRMRHHRELKELFRSRMGDAVAEDFEESFRMGELGATVKNQQSILKEEEFDRMIDLASVVRNAVVRLERGEVSPPWKSPVGYVLIRVQSAGLSGLEGEFEDFEDLTLYEYERTHFYLWANEVLAGVKQVVAN